MKIEITSDNDLQNAQRYTEIASRYRKDWRGESSPDLVDKYQIFLEMLGKGKSGYLTLAVEQAKPLCFFQN